MKYIDHINRSISNSLNGISKLSEEVLAIPGMSSAKVKHFLNNLLEIDNVKYLEIGVWLGSTFVSAMYKNKPIQSFAIDNFCEKEGFSSCKELFHCFCKGFLDPSTYEFIEEDSFKIDLSKIKLPVNIYFYDGGHSVESQEKALTYYDKILADTFIYIADDYNFQEVRDGTKIGIEKMNYNIDFETVLTANHNQDYENWWNGLYVSVLSKRK